MFALSREICYVVYGYRRALSSEGAPNINKSAVDTGNFRTDYWPEMGD
jgi:hypothetical protein